MSDDSLIRNLNPLRLIAVLMRHRALILQLTVRNIATEVKGSVLGIFWTVLNPLLMLAVFAVVFGGIFGSTFPDSPHPGPTDFILGLFLALALFGLVADLLAQSPRLILSNPNYVKKVVFPLETLPAALAGAAIYRFAVTMVLVLLGSAIFGHGFTWKALLFPLTAGPLLLVGLGMAYLFSALGVFFRDIAQATGVISMILLYASGIFYAASKVQEGAPHIWTWLQWNPLLLSIEASRRVLLWEMWPAAGPLAYSWVFAIVLCALGYACFCKLRPAFADVL